MIYKYRARTPDGKVENGSIEATSVDGVVAILRGKKFLPLSIESEEDQESGSTPQKKKNKEDLLNRMRLISTVSLKEKAVFFTQLATMIKAGVTIGESLTILGGQTKNYRFSDAINKVKRSVDGGISMSSAMKEFKVFPPLATSILNAGEEGGTLDSSLEQVADFFERQDNLHKKIISAISYPAVVMVFSMFVLYLLITVVIPKFASVFDNLNVELPWATRIMFSFGMWMADNYILFLSCLFFVVGGLFFLAGWKSTKPTMDRIKLKLPIFGDLLFKAGMARSSRTLSSLTHSGIPILQALEMTSRVADNYVFESAFKGMETGARKGIGLGISAGGIKLFPPMVAHMIRVGEETGQLDQMLDKVADWFELEMDEKIKRLTAIMEPLMIIFVGGIVAMVALAIFSPIVAAIQGML